MDQIVCMWSWNKELKICPAKSAPLVYRSWYYGVMTDFRDFVVR